MESCHVFLAVLDPGYIERVVAVESAPLAEGWVTDEFYMAISFADEGILMLLGLLREGDVLPFAFREFAAGQGWFGDASATFIGTSTSHVSIIAWGRSVRS
jgi:hypothetical protein